MLNLKSNLKDFFRYLFRPKFWDMMLPYSHNWDMQLRFLLDNAKECKIYFNPISNSYLTMTINDTEIWIGNYPYSYGWNRSEHWSRETRVRPSRRTIERLHKFIEEKKKEDLKPYFDYFK